MMRKCRENIVFEKYQQKKSHKLHTLIFNVAKVLFFWRENSNNKNIYFLTV